MFKRIWRRLFGKRDEDVGTHEETDGGFLVPPGFRDSMFAGIIPESSNNIGIPLVRPVPPRPGSSQSSSKVPPVRACEIKPSRMSPLAVVKERHPHPWPHPPPAPPILVRMKASEIRIATRWFAGAMDSPPPSWAIDAGLD